MLIEKQKNSKGYDPDMLDVSCNLYKMGQREIKKLQRYIKKSFSDMRVSCTRMVQL